MLPIAERELRVASRRKITFWGRITAAVVALVIGIGFLVIIGMSGMSPTALGKQLFPILTWLCFAVAISAGLFFTSDCVSEENREGTLGFLFLTDLRGYDVVIGKLLAQSLRSFYGVLAVFPVFAVTLLLGGVTGTEFWQACVALVITLLVSLATGMVVSVHQRDSQRALTGTLLAIIVVCAAGPALDEVLRSWDKNPFDHVFAYTSPVYLFRNVGRPAAIFWAGVAGNVMLMAAFLSIACWRIPHIWQQRASAGSNGTRAWQQVWKFGGPERRLAMRRKLLTIHPISWLVLRERWQGLSLWLVALLMAAAETALMVWGEPTMWYVANQFVGAMVLLIYIIIAAQATRFFVEGRRSGLLEMLAISPLREGEIVRGQWRAMLRQCGMPLVICFITLLLASGLSQRFIVSVGTSGAKTGTSALANVALAAGALGALLKVAGNVVALIWVGMWMGLISRTSNLATLKTLLFVQVIPWMVIGFVTIVSVQIVLMTRVFAGKAGTSVSYGLVFSLCTTAVSTSLYLAKDVFFYLWARRKLGGASGAMGACVLRMRAA